MMWKSVCDLGTIAILLDQPRLRSLNSGDAVLPKMDSKDGLHPKLIHTLGVFPVNPLELQTMVNLRSLSKRLFFS